MCARVDALRFGQQQDQLGQESLVDRGVNVLAFGLPGTGKSHALCAVGHRLAEAGHSVLFAPAYRLVQELLAAKRTWSSLVSYHTGAAQQRGQERGVNWQI